MAKQIKIDFQITQASQLSLSQAIEYTALILKRSLKSVLTQTAVFFVQSASKLTPQSKKSRKYEKINRNKDDTKYYSSQNYRIAKFNRQSLKFEWVYARYQHTAKKKALIQNRGLYKKTWYSMLPRLGKSNNKSFSDAKASNFAKNSTTVDNKSFKDQNPFILLNNKRSEISKMAPGIMGQALLRAKMRLFGMMKNQVAKKIERAWNKK